MLNENLTEENLPEQDLPAADFLIEEITRRRRTIENAQAEAEAILEARKKSIEDWLARTIAPEQAEIDRLEPILYSIVKRKTAGTGKKSLNLPSGRAGFKSVAPQFFFHGEKADAGNSLFVIALNAKGNCAFIKQKPVLDWANMRKTLRIGADGLVCTADGEVIDGLTATIRPDQFYINPKEP